MKFAAVLFRERDFGELLALVALRAGAFLFANRTYSLYPKSRSLLFVVFLGMQRGLAAFWRVEYSDG